MQYRWPPNKVPSSAEGARRLRFGGRRTPEEFDRVAFWTSHVDNSISSTRALCKGLRHPKPLPPRRLDTTKHLIEISDSKRKMR